MSEWGEGHGLRTHATEFATSSANRGDRRAEFRRHRLAAQYALPAIYDNKAAAAVGGLMSYGTNGLAAARQVGEYVARILRGQKPSELPVLQPTRFELVINLKTAKSLDLSAPSALLARADELIE